MSIFGLIFFLLSFQTHAASVETDGVCLRGSLQHKRSWAVKLYDGKKLFLMNIAIVNPDGSFFLQEVFIDWNEVKGSEGVVGYEKVKEKQTLEYVTDKGEHKKRTLTMYKHTRRCQTEILKRMKTDKPWLLPGADF